MNLLVLVCTSPSSGAASGQLAEKFSPDSHILEPKTLIGPFLNHASQK